MSTDYRSLSSPDYSNVQPPTAPKPAPPPGKPPAKPSEPPPHIDREALEKLQGTAVEEAKKQSISAPPLAPPTERAHMDIEAVNKNTQKMLHTVRDNISKEKEITKQFDSAYKSIGLEKSGEEIAAKREALQKRKNEALEKKQAIDRQLKTIDEKPVRGSRASISVNRMTEKYPELRKSFAKLQDSKGKLTTQTGKQAQSFVDKRIKEDKAVEKERLERHLLPPLEIDLIQNLQRTATKENKKEEKPISSNDFLYTYHFVKGMTSEKLFKSISTVLTDDLAKLKASQGKDLKTKAKIFSTLAFCRDWIKSDLYPKDLKEKKVQNELQKIADACQKEGLPIDIELTGGLIQDELEQVISQTSAKKQVNTNELKPTPDPSNAKNVKQLTYEFDALFRQATNKIEFGELLIDQSKSEELSKAPNVTSLTELINQTTNFVNNAILGHSIDKGDTKSAEEAKSKAFNAISNFITIADNLHKQKNYAASLAIYSALANNNVSTLIENDDRVKPFLSKKDMATLSTLGNDLSMTGNFKNLRKKIASDQEKGESYLAPPVIINKDLTFAKEGKFLREDGAPTEQFSVAAKILRNAMDSINSTKKNLPESKTNLHEALKNSPHPDSDKFYQARLALVPSKRKQA